MNTKALASLLAATGAEVSGIIYWYEFLQLDRYLAAFVALILGEAVEFALLAALIMTAVSAYPRRSGRVNSVLIRTGVVIFGEALLWFAWIFAIDLVGVFAATGFLLLLMHVKHTAAVSFFHGRRLSADIFDREGLAATVLEVGGATAFYLLATHGFGALGGLALAVCIGLEHCLQFRAAGIFDKDSMLPLHS